MECPHCGFENIPGTRNCFHCHKDVSEPVQRIRAVVSDSFYPPRAPRKKGLLPTRQRHRLARLRMLLTPSSAGGMRDRSLLIALLYSILPGGGHLYLGYPKFGILFLAILGASLLFLIISYPCGPYMLAANLVAILYSYTWSDISIRYEQYIRAPIPTLRKRIGYSLLGFGFAFFSIWGIYSLYANELYTSVQIPWNYLSPDIQANDIVMVNLRAYLNRHPQEGEIVLISPGRYIPYFEILSRSRQSVVIARILARGPAQINIENNFIMIDGRPVRADWLPPNLNIENLRLNLHLDTEYFFILPASGRNLRIPVHQIETEGTMFYYGFNYRRPLIRGRVERVQRPRAHAGPIPDRTEDTAS